MNAGKLSVDNAIKIKCQFCEIADACSRRQHKEKYEDAGYVTRCTLTPNRPGVGRKKRQKKAKKRVKA